MITPLDIAIRINKVFKLVNIDLPVRIVLTKKVYECFDNFLREQSNYDEPTLDYFKSHNIKVTQSNLRDVVGKGFKPNQFMLMGIVFEEEQ